MKTGNPNESAGKNRSTFSLRIKALKKNLTRSKLTFSSLMELKIQIFEKNVLLICIHLSYGTALFPTVLVNVCMIKNVFIYGFSSKVLNIFTQMLMSKIDLYIFTSEKPYFIILLIILIKHLASYYKPQYLLQYQSDKCFNGTVVNPALPSSYSSEQLFFEIFVLINTFLNTDLNVECGKHIYCQLVVPSF